MIAGGIAEPYGTGGEAVGGASSTGGTPTDSPDGTGGVDIGAGGGEIDGGVPVAFVGGAGGAAPVGGGGTAGEGAVSAWDGWLIARISQSTECVSAGQPLSVEVHVGQAAESLAVYGIRTVVAPDGTEECLPNYVDQACVVAEEFGVSLVGAEADQVMESFSYLPDATCTNDGVRCEMPCDAPTLEVDGVVLGSTFCCGTFDDPEYARRAQGAIDLLMVLVDAELAASDAE